MADGPRLALIESNYDDLTQTAENLLKFNAQIVKIEVMGERRNVIHSKKATNTQTTPSLVSIGPINKRNIATDSAFDNLNSQNDARRKKGLEKSDDLSIGYAWLTLADNNIETKYWQLRL